MNGTLELIIKLYEKVGPWWTLLFLLLGVGGPILGTYLRDRSLRKAFEGVVNEKEASIQRLAADNRIWRRQFFKDAGWSDTELEAILDDRAAAVVMPPSKPPATRVSSPPASGELVEKGTPSEKEGQKGKPGSLKKKKSN